MNAFKDLALYLLIRGVYLAPDLAADMEVIGAIKTYDYFLQALTQSIGDLYNGKIAEGDFSDNLAGLMEQQLRRAFNEGMRMNDLDPAVDMTPEWEQIYQDAVVEQYQYIEGFAADIVQGALDGVGVGQFKARAALWAQRYNDMVNTAMSVTADNKDRQIWIEGDTVDKCPTCTALNGIVAWKEEWEASGFHPGGTDNESIDCHGWRCQCRLEPTDQRRTPKALETLMNIATARNM